MTGCNGRHTLDQQLLLCFLIGQDRFGDGSPLVRESFGATLGMRRSGVAMTLIALAQAGILDEEPVGCRLGALHGLR